MRDEEKKCPEKWDQTQLLAYIEGDMDKAPAGNWKLTLRIARFVRLNSNPYEKWIFS